MLDDGRITDGQGRTVNFKNTIIILTSNIGSQAIVEAGGDESKQDEVRVGHALLGPTPTATPTPNPHRYPYAHPHP